MTKNRSLFGNLFLFAAALVWGLAFSTQKIVSRHLPPFTVNCGRFLFVGLLMLPMIPLFDRLAKNGRTFLSLEKKRLDFTRAELLGGALCGVALLVAASLQQLSLANNHVGPGRASFLTALYVVFVPFFSLLRRKIAAPNVWVSVGIAIFGAYLLTSGGIGSFALGGYDIMLLCSAAFFALHIVIIDIFVTRVDGIRMSVIQFLTAGTLSIPLMIFVDPLVAPAPAMADFLAALPSMIYLCILSGGVGYTAQILGQKLSGTPTIAALIMSLESVFGLLGGVLFLREHLNGYQLGGCAVIFFAVIFSQLPLKDWYHAVKVKRSTAAITSTPPSDRTAPSDDPPPPTDSNV